MTQKRVPESPSYMLPNRLCATCGRPTGGRLKGSSGNVWGEQHWECRRDGEGRLVTVPGSEAA